MIQKTELRRILDDALNENVSEVLIFTNSAIANPCLPQALACQVPAKAGNLASGFTISDTWLSEASVTVTEPRDAVTKYRLNKAEAYNSVA